MHWFTTAAAAGSVLLSSTVQASKLTPPVLPLVVRNPYLSTWLSHGREAPWTEWPMFWTGERVRTMTFHIPIILTPEHSFYHGHHH